MKWIKSLQVLALTASLTMSSSQAATVALYDFNADGAANNLAPALTGISNVTTFSETGFGHQGVGSDVGYAGNNDDNAGVSSTGNNYYFRASAGDGADLSEAISGGSSNIGSGSATNTGNDYSGFSITVDSGYVLNLNSLTFDIGVNQGGPSNFSVLTSVNGFTSSDSEGDYAFDNSGATSVASITGTDFDTLVAGTYEFRFYTYGATTLNNPSRIDNVQLNGTVSVIPEPSTYLLLMAGLGALYMLRRR